MAGPEVAEMTVALRAERVAWEYRLVAVPGDARAEAALDQVGADGWELVSVQAAVAQSLLGQAGQVLVCIFKRPVEDKAPGLPDASPCFEG